MKLIDIVTDSAFCSIGCITKEEDIETLQSYIMYNIPVIEQFPEIIVAHTKTSNIEDKQLLRYNQSWVDAFGEKVTVLTRPNFGHTFGFVDLDTTVLCESFASGAKWAWKSTNDILLTENIFNVEMDDTNFFYLQGQGVTGVKTYYNNDVDLAAESLGNEDWDRFFPQTNFYITTTKTDSLISHEEFDKKYKAYISDPEYGKTPQLEYKYMLAECIVRDFIKRNNLKTKHLISKESYRKLINAILIYNIVDGSHKNVFLTECGVCHYHWKDKDVIEI